MVVTAERGEVVEVLLATYNGETFLREQIDSILQQDYPALRVLARDDGSEDGTVAILEDYVQRERRFQVLPQSGAALGAKRNFLVLMAAATTEYVCFADQDDVWLPGKVRVTMKAMRRLEERHGTGIPLLVFTDLTVVDADLEEIANSMWARAGIEPQSIHRLARLLGQNVVTGCTAMINRPMLELALRMPEEATMHDRWIGLLAASMGKAEVVRERTVLYRQHGGNVIGAAAQDDSLGGIAGRVRDDRSRRAERWRSHEQAAALLKTHEAEMPERSRELLRAYLKSGSSASRVVRVWTMLRYGLFRSGVTRNLATLLDLWRATASDGMESASIIRFPVIEKGATPDRE